MAIYDQIANLGSNFNPLGAFSQGENFVRQNQLYQQQQQTNALANRIAEEKRIQQQQQSQSEQERKNKLMELAGQVARGDRNALAQMAAIDPGYTQNFQKAIGTGQTMPFEGTGMDAQVYNSLIGYNQKKAQGLSTTPQEDMAYNLVYQRASKPYIVTTPDGRAIEVPGMDLSRFAPPGGGSPQFTTSGMTTGQPRIGTARGRVIGEKPYTEAETTSASFANRMSKAENLIGNVMSQGYDPTSERDIYGGSIPLIGNYITTPQGKLYRQAQEDWVRAKLRKESGAVIGADEMADEIKTYFPQPGDTQAVIAQKEQARKTAVNNLIEGSQGAAQKMFNLRTSNGQTPQRKQAGPKIGQEENGYIYIGGDPANPKSWKKAR